MYEMEMLQETRLCELETLVQVGLETLVYELETLQEQLCELETLVYELETLVQVELETGDELEALVQVGLETGV